MGSIFYLSYIKISVTCLEEFEVEKQLKFTTRAILKRRLLGTVVFIQC